MKIFLVLIWALILIVCTCNLNLGLLVRQHTIYFDFDPNPDFSGMLKFFDYNRIHTHWVLVKIGHFSGFGMMYLLLVLYLRAFLIQGSLPIQIIAMIKCRSSERHFFCRQHNRIITE